MHSVIETPTYLAQAKHAGVVEAELVGTALYIASDPEAGVVMAGTGRARKLCHAGRGHGKSGGFRTVYYFGGQDVPVFLQAICGKGEKDNLSKAKRNDLAAVLPLFDRPLPPVHQIERRSVMSFGKDLVQSAREDLAIVEGELELGPIHVFEVPDVAAIRKRQRLTQAAFAARYRIPVATVRDWEQKRRTPDGASASFLRGIEREPEAVTRALETPAI